MNQAVGSPLAALVRVARIVGRPLLVLIFLTCMPARESALAATAKREATKDRQPLKKKAATQKKRLPHDARLAFIRKAQIWTPTNIPEMDLRSGPQGPGAFQPNEMVT